MLVKEERMKVTLHHVFAVAHEVELPEGCPHCGASFHASFDGENTLLEGRFELHNAYCGIEKGELNWLGGTGTHSNPSGDLSVYYRCYVCGKNVIEANESTYDFLAVLRRLAAGDIHLPKPEAVATGILEMLGFKE